MEEIDKEKLRNNAKIYLLFVVLPVITYLPAHYILSMNNVHNPTYLYYLLASIFGVLFIAGLIVAIKESLDIAITATLIPVVSVLLIPLVAFSLAIHSYHTGNVYSITAYEMNDTNTNKIPDNCTLVSDKDLKEYPKLKKSLNKNEEISLTESEFNKLDQQLTEYYIKKHGDFRCIKYKEKHYAVYLIHSTP